VLSLLARSSPTNLLTLFDRTRIVSPHAGSRLRLRDPLLRRASQERTDSTKYVGAKSIANGEFNPFYHAHVELCW
jgi:hypothetical protein